MDAKQIETEALALPESVRAGLVWRLLETLPPSDIEISDEEIAQRNRDLDAGVVEAITDEEFVQRVEAERKR
jgi:hypothetical protein